MDLYSIMCVSDRIKALEWFEAFFGRPAGLAVMKDGSLLVSDDTNGVIYRVRYSGASRT